jgi:hypothetical protein
MMKELEKRMAAADFVGKEFMAGAKTYKVAKADNFSYTDPIDGSVSQHQVESLVGFFSLFFFSNFLNGDFSSTLHFHPPAWLDPTSRPMTHFILTFDRRHDMEAPLPFKKCPHTSKQGW